MSDGSGSLRRAISLYKDLEIGPVPLRGTMESPSLIVERLCVGEQWVLRLDGLVGPKM